MIELKIPLVAPSLNKWYSGIHWAERKKIVDLWHDTVWKLCRVDKIKPLTLFPVTISTQSFTKSKRKRDVSNGICANKMAEDALVEAGILPNDAPEYVSRHIIEKPVIGHSEDMTLIKIWKE